MRFLWLISLVGALVLSGSGRALAQSYTVTSITLSDFGEVASGASGDSVLRAAASDGAVTKVSGSGARVSSGSVRALVTVACGNQMGCNSELPKVTITAIGTATKRAKALSNFTVSGGTVSLNTQPGSGNAITFLLNPIGRSSSKTFYVGFDATYQGDSSNLATGVATSQFNVVISRNNGTGSATGTGSVNATLFRSLGVSTLGNLVFGRVAKPRSGLGTATIAAGALVVSAEGDGVVAFPSPAPRVASIQITGESGQDLSISVPATFQMTGNGDPIVVSTLPTLSGNQVLSVSTSGIGSLTIDVGGSMSLSPTVGTGDYGGEFKVIVQYN